MANTTLSTWWRNEDAGVDADFSGETARLYARYRRDLPADQARELAWRMGLQASDVVVDLGCGTGQLAVPLRPHCAGVVGVDPEPQMLAGLRTRRVEGVLCVLADDGELPQLGRRLAGPVGAVVVGNALHWMDEPATLRACAQLVRPGGGVAVVTQGPPLWLGNAAWQRRVRRVLEQAVGAGSGTCRSDPAAVRERVAVLEGLGLDVQVATWRAEYEVDADWVVGHLGSALPPGVLQNSGALIGGVRTALAEIDAVIMVEDIITTAVIAQRPS